MGRRKEEDEGEEHRCLPVFANLLPGNGRGNPLTSFSFFPFFHSFFFRSEKLGEKTRFSHADLKNPKNWIGVAHQPSLPLFPVLTLNPKQPTQNKEKTVVHRHRRRHCGVNFAHVRPFSRIHFLDKREREGKRRGGSHGFVPGGFRVSELSRKKEEKKETSSTKAHV